MKLDTALRAAVAPRATRERPLSFFEFWPDWLFYFPVVVHWLALGVRYGDFMLPTAANPTITAGGLCGESKHEILDQVQGSRRALLARYTSVVAQRGCGAAAEAAMAEAASPIRWSPSPTSAATAPVSACCRSATIWRAT